MEGPEEFMGSTTDHTAVVSKGKRTKRQRTLSPFGAVMTSSSSSGGGGGGGGGGLGRGDYSSINSSPTSSGTDQVMESTEEEEDMANCLILLAQGLGPRRLGEGEKLSGPSFAEMATAATVSAAGKGGFYVYECKTCNRTFPSFQALGGHRASHKKPKAAAVAGDQDKKLPATAAALWEDEYYEDGQFMSKISASPVSVQIGKGLHSSSSSSKSKVHECSICGSEFSSGQALGGHMRRHRSNGGGSSTSGGRISMSMERSSSSKMDDQPEPEQEAEEKKEKEKEKEKERRRNILPLDLNLPAPEDELHHRGESKFQFASTQQQHLVFSAPALVDCHY